METLSSENGSSPASPLLRLPFELRLMIYEHLLCPTKLPTINTGTSVANLLTDYHTYYSGDTNDDASTLSVRTVDPWLGAQGSRTWRRRSTYHVRTGPFLTTTTPTTYRVLLSPYTAHLRHTIPSLLSLNRQIHAEASKVLYSTYTFSFHTSIEAVVPFLSDLTPLARSAIRHISLTKKALPYTKEFDRAEWSALCAYIAAGHDASRRTLTQSMQNLGHNQNQTSSSAPDAQAHEVEMGFLLHTLNINIIGGKPDIGWDEITPITAPDFATMVRMKKEWGGGGAFGGVELDWVEELMVIRGLRDVRVRALVEHCPRPAESEKLAFWVAFSKSVVEGGVGEWVRGVMLEGQ